MFVHKITYDSNFIFRKWKKNEIPLIAMMYRVGMCRVAEQISKIRPAYDAFYVNFILNKNK